MELLDEKGNFKTFDYYKDQVYKKFDEFGDVVSNAVADINPFDFMKTVKEDTNASDMDKIDVVTRFKSFMDQVSSTFKSEDEPEQPKPYTHKVVSGDTLWDISRQYGVKMADLQRNSDSKYLQIGEEITINNYDSPVEEKQETAPKAKEQYGISNITKADGTKVTNIDNLLHFVPSHVRSFLADLTTQSKDVVRDESFFAPKELDAVLTLVKRSMDKRQNKNKGFVDYKDYKGEVKHEKMSAAPMNLTGEDPEITAKLTLGQFNWHINKDGDLIVTDQYNFNDAKDLRAKYPTTLDKIKFLTDLAHKAATTDEVGYYALARHISALYGSKEGEGAKFNINLGKVNFDKIRS